MVASLFKSYGLKVFGYDDYFLTTVGSVGFFFGALRFIWALLVDKIGFKKTYAIILVIQMFTSLTINVLGQYPAVYFIWVTLLLTCEGAHFAMAPAICPKLFGD